tara:strand:+ start:1202 stop:1447 length:246 start_codon:yes stop_codon:yes gene_type:complete
MDLRLVKVTMIVAIPDNGEKVGPDSNGTTHYTEGARDYWPGAETGSDYYDFKIIEWDETDMHLVEAPPLEAPVKPTKKISK